MKNLKKTLAVINAAVIAALTVSGCGETKTADSGERKIDFWIPISGAASAVVENLGETPVYKQLQKDVNAEINFIHPSGGSLAEQFNILMASDELPDVIQYDWTKYPGGPQKAIDDGVILDLSQYKDKLPNLMKYLDEHKDIKKLVETDLGALFAFPFIRGDESLCVSWGMVVRKDWLDELGIEPPETIDEWESMLTAFKEKKGASAPLCIGTSVFANAQFVGAYNTTMGYYIDKGEVKYGMLQPAFKDFLTKMHSWYEKGLLDKNFTLLDNTAIDSNILNGESGAIGTSIGNGIGRYMTTPPDDKFDLIGVKSPVLVKGDTPEFGYLQSPVALQTNSFTAISTSCKNIDAALEIFDYGYSDAGHMLYNFGIEGESYNMIDGYPTYTDKITHAEDGSSMMTMLSQYTVAYSSGPFVQDKRYMEQYAAIPQQKQAWKTWTETNMKEHLLPNLYIKADSQDKLALLDSAINTYADEMISKLIIGTESLDNYDKIIDGLKERGIEESLKIRNDAYQSYLKK
ncbi:MAG: extracellular solute-binding protein [Clostridia bacterium]|nr:extracellular solute-binding protein [Clostridia bacterium]